MFIEEINDYKSIKDHSRIEFIFDFTIRAIENKLYDIIYNIIIEWNWIELLIVNCDYEKLKTLLLLAKKTNIEFEYYSSWNNKSNFNVYNNIRDLYEINDKYDFIEYIENI